MILLALLFSMQVTQTENVRLIVIVSSSQKLTDISSTDLRAIYLGDLTRWPTRHAIVPIIPSTNTRGGEAFIRRLIKMAELDYAQHWIGMVFRGQAASAPLVADSTEQAAKFVSTHVDAIAIVADIPTEKNVHVLSVDGKSPDAGDYPLRW
jgi:hypothetical protein